MTARASALAAAGASNFSSSGNVVSTSERFSARVAGDELGQAVIALRADDEIDGRRATHDLGAFGLGHAADDRDHRVVAGGGALVLQDADAPEIGVDLLGRLLADVAGVENDEIGVLDGIRFGIALRRQRLGHALGIVDVHLTAERAHEHLAPADGRVRRRSERGRRFAAVSLRHFGRQPIVHQLACLSPFAGAPRQPYRAGFVQPLRGTARLHPLLPRLGGDPRPH